MGRKKSGGRLRRISPPVASPLPLEFEALPDDENWSDNFGHWPVMGREALSALAVKPDGFYVDATLGGGGHSRLILSALGPEGRLLSLDQDPEPLKWAQDGWAKEESRLTLALNNFAELAEILAREGLPPPDGILADLGLNSRQLLSPQRGFSINHDAPLDMRLSPENPLTAGEVVNSYPEKKLADLIFRYGEERASRRVARGLVWAREKKPIASTRELAAIVARSLYRPGPPARIHPATKTFMALRIEVNGELAVLEKFLTLAPQVLGPEGRLVVISFHSLEDRLVKEAFRIKDSRGEPLWQALFKKPQTPGEEELLQNPRARSAKLRAAQKI